MYAGKDFPVCSPDETFDRGFDFVNDFTFDSEEEIASAEWLCEQAPGSDADDEAAAGRLTDDPPSVLGSDLSGRNTITGARFAGMLDGVTYRLTARVTTTRNQVLELFAHQPCRTRA